MSVSDHDLICAWTQVLRLSKCKADDCVTLLTSTNTHPQTLRTAIVALQSIGATVNTLDLQPVNGDKAIGRDPLAYLGVTPLTGNRAALAALKSSDLVIDLMLLLFSPEQHEILAGGTRILLAVEPPEVLLRMVPTEADRTRVKAAAERLKTAREMTIQSDAGTDLVCTLGEFPAVAEYGLADEPGRWDHWPSGFVLTWPNEGGSNGRIVIDRGDILLPQKRYVLDAIELTVKDGFITSIDGGVDAAMFREFIESFEDPDAYAMAHIGWGLQPKARWSTLGFYGRETTIGMDARAYEGNFLFSMGPNNEVGGTRATAFHMDIPLRNCSISLDGNRVVTDGRIIE